MYALIQKIIYISATVLSPVAGPSLVVPYGVPIWSLSVLYLTLPQDKFFEFQFTSGFCSFLNPYFFYPPEVDQPWWYPMESPFEIFLSYIIPNKRFLDLNFWAVSAHFWTLYFFFDVRVVVVMGPKKVLRFCSKKFRMQFRWYKYSPISVFVTSCLLVEKNPIWSSKFWKF